MPDNTPSLILYSTLGCHLCEEAKKICWPVLQQHGFRLDIIDIADDPCLLEKYALKIPVLYKNSDDKELAWPFSEEQLVHFLMD